MVEANGPRYTVHPIVRVGEHYEAGWSIPLWAGDDKATAISKATEYDGHRYPHGVLIFDHRTRQAWSP